MFAKLSLRGKILVFPSVAAVGFFSVLLVAWVLGARNTTLQNAIETGYAPALLLSVELEKTLVSIERGLQEAAVTEDADVFLETDALRRQFLALVDRARDNPVMDVRKLGAIDVDFKAYYRLARETTARVIAGNMEAEVMASTQQMSEQFRAIQDNLEASTRRDEQAMASAFALARRNLERSFSAVMTVTGLFILLLGILSWWLGRMITLPMVRLTAAAKRIASEDMATLATEANLMAIATAKHATGRSSVLAFHHAYHGGVLYFGEGGRPLLVPHDWVMARYNDLPSVEAAFEARGDDIACVIVEPMLAASGCIPGKPEFLAGLRSITMSAGSVLVFDEVMTSRLSPGGAQEALGITPDMTTLGKYLAGGLTIGAFGGKRELMSVFDPDSGGTLTHGGTFNNNEISAAAGIAALAEMLTPGVIETVNNRGDRLREALNSVFDSAGLPMCVTGLGSLMTVHVSGGPVQFPEDVVGSDDRLKELLFLEMLERGFYMARRGFMALSIDVTDEDLDSLVAVVSEWADWARGLSG